MRVTSHRSNERGIALVFVAICMVALCGAAAFTIDLGNGWATAGWPAAI